MRMVASLFSVNIPERYPNKFYIGNVLAKEKLRVRQAS